MIQCSQRSTSLRSILARTSLLQCELDPGLVLVWVVEKKLIIFDDVDHASVCGAQNSRSLLEAGVLDEMEQVNVGTGAAPHSSQPTTSKSYTMFVPLASRSRVLRP